MFNKITRDNLGWRFVVPEDSAFETDTRNGVPVWSLPADNYYGLVYFEQTLKEAMEPGDKVEWWHSDTNNLPDIYLGGELRKASGEVLPLTGHMDAGARTGRPPVLRLKRLSSSFISPELMGAAVSQLLND